MGVHQFIDLLLEILINPALPSARLESELLILRQLDIYMYETSYQEGDSGYILYPDNPRG